MPKVQNLKQNFYMQKNKITKYFDSVQSIETILTHILHVTKQKSRKD